jgi:hypothetical protein
LLHSKSLDPDDKPLSQADSVTASCAESARSVRRDRNARSSGLDGELCSLMSRFTAWLDGHCHPEPVGHPSHRPTIAGATSADPAGVGCDRNLGSGTFGGADFSGCDGFYDARHPCPTPLLRMSRHCPPQQLLPLLWCSSRTSRQVRPCAAASASLPCRCPRDTQLKKWGLL